VRDVISFNKWQHQPLYCLEGKTRPGCPEPHVWLHLTSNTVVSSWIEEIQHLVQIHWVKQNIPKAHNCIVWPVRHSQLDITQAFSFQTCFCAYSHSPINVLLGYITIVYKIFLASCVLGRMCLWGTTFLKIVHRISCLHGMLPNHIHNHPLKSFWSHGSSTLRSNNTKNCKVP